MDCYQGENNQEGRRNIFLGIQEGLTMEIISISSITETSSGSSITTIPKDIVDDEDFEKIKWKKDSKGRIILEFKE